MPKREIIEAVNIWTRGPRNSTRSHLAQVRNAQHKTDGIEDVGFPTAVQAGDGIEMLMEAGDYGTLGVGLEALYDDAFYVHGGRGAMDLGRVAGGP